MQDSEAQEGAALDGQAFAHGVEAAVRAVIPDGYFFRTTLREGKYRTWVLFEFAANPKGIKGDPWTIVGEFSNVGIVPGPLRRRKMCIATAYQGPKLDPFLDSIIPFVHVEYTEVGKFLAEYFKGIVAWVVADRGKSE